MAEMKNDEICVNEKKRVHIAVPKETAAIVEELAERFDETNGKIVKIAVAEYAKKVLK